jgi:hypothetical protein
MSEWWTYSLSDFLLFSPRTYYRLFELYNADIWPGQVAALVLGFAILVLLRSQGAQRGRIIAGILAACWLWVAWGFLYTRYATINWAASWFATIFAVQALLLILVGVIAGKLSFGAGGHRAGLGLVVFALLIQPLIGPLVGRKWTEVELFGLAPDPTVVATLGVLVVASPGVGWGARWLLLVVPILWCAISGATAQSMASSDALVLPTAATLALGLAAWTALSRRPGHP